MLLIVFVSHLMIRFGTQGAYFFGTLREGAYSLNRAFIFRTVSFLRTNQVFKIEL